jgi:hypothetical protein
MRESACFADTYLHVIILYLRNMTLSAGVPFATFPSRANANYWFFLVFRLRYSVTLPNVRTLNPESAKYLFVAGSVHKHWLAC